MLSSVEQVTVDRSPALDSGCADLLNVVSIIVIIHTGYVASMYSTVHLYVASTVCMRAVCVSRRCMCTVICTTV